MMSVTTVIAIGLIVGITIMSIVIFGIQMYVIISGKATYMKDRKFIRGSAAYLYGLPIF